MHEWLIEASTNPTADGRVTRGDTEGAVKSSLLSSVPRSFIIRGAVPAIYRRCEFTAGVRKLSAPIAVPVDNCPGLT